MVSTVTTTVTTVATLANGPALAVVAVLLLIGLLVTKELAESAEGLLAQRLARVTLIGIMPLLFVFMLIVVSKVQAALH